ncbi:hypothetical protein, partial [Achromobacter xylosoxidans]|uniref:hypothetical protein n=1 Tax=Alcaligenes xylosoxydans xylosoxydans TaxID=85698 RepID=UPI0015C5A790
LQRAEPPARLGKPCAVPPAADAGAARRADGAADACAAVAGAEVIWRWMGGARKPENKPEILINEIHLIGGFIYLLSII